MPICQPMIRFQFKLWWPGCSHSDMYDVEILMAGRASAYHGSIMWLLSSELFWWVEGKALIDSDLSLSPRLCRVTFARLRFSRLQFRGWAKVLRNVPSLIRLLRVCLSNSRAGELRRPPLSWIVQHLRLLLRTLYGIIIVFL